MIKILLVYVDKATVSVLNFNLKLHLRRINFCLCKCGGIEFV